MTLENSLPDFAKPNMHFSNDSAIILFGGIYPEKVYVHTKTCVRMFRVNLYSKILETTQLSLRGCMVEQTLGHADTGIPLCNKTNEIIIYANSWVDLKDITFSERKLIS